MKETAVYAAGAVVWRVVDGKVHVLLVHRTKYRDVTLPKGKVDPGEMLIETAAREVFEETGVAVRLGAPLGVSRYHLPNGRTKIVHYWAAEATDEAVRTCAFVPNKEIAALEWVNVKKAASRLSYPVDHEIIDDFLRLIDDGVLRTFPVVALRHAKAVTRDDWPGADTDRPLAPRGKKQAKRLVGPLAAFGVTKVISSPAVRCVKTVAPLAKSLGMPVERSALISQDEWERGRSDVRAVIGTVVRGRRGVVLCSHGPVLPDILSELALATGTLRGSYLGSASALDPAEYSVVHLSESNPGSGIIAIETHEPKV